MITPSDSFFTYDIDNYYAILPSKPVWSLDKFIEKFNAKKVEQNFSYNHITILNGKRLTL